MTNNDILRQLRYALHLNDAKMVDIFSISDFQIDQDELLDMMKKDDEDGYIECSNTVLTWFLDGFIIKKRGKKEAKPGEIAPDPAILNNNLILKKLRIGLEFKEDDMLEIFRLGEFPIQKAELTALFRNKNHRNYKPCGDQLIRYFIRGLTTKFRK